jgi:hypothetical protein
MEEPAIEKVYPCPVCGGTKFTQGRVFDSYGFWFMPKHLTAFKKLTSGGEVVTAGKCETCGNLLLRAGGGTSKLRPDIRQMFVAAFTMAGVVTLAIFASETWSGRSLTLNFLGFFVLAMFAQFVFAPLLKAPSGRDDKDA